jgi:hypothetical protein
VKVTASQNDPSAPRPAAFSSCLARSHLNDGCSKCPDLLLELRAPALQGLTLLSELAARRVQQRLPPEERRVSLDLGQAGAPLRALPLELGSALREPRHPQGAPGARERRRRRVGQEGGRGLDERRRELSLHDAPIRRDRRALALQLRDLGLVAPDRPVCDVYALSLRPHVVRSSQFAAPPSAASSWAPRPSLPVVLPERREQPRAQLRPVAAAHHRREVSLEPGGHLEQSLELRLVPPLGPAREGAVESARHPASSS